MFFYVLARLTFHNKPKTWTEARTFCRRNGGQLVHAYTGNQYDLKKLIDTERHHKMWSGWFSTLHYVYEGKGLPLSSQYFPQQDTLRLLSRHEQTMICRLRTGHYRLRSHMKKDWNWRVSYLPLRTWSANHSPCPAVMPSPQKRKRKHLANRNFPRKQTPRNSHRPTPDGAVHRPDGTTNITSLHRTLKKKKKKNCNTV